MRYRMRSLKLPRVGVLSKERERSRLSDVRDCALELSTSHGAIGAVVARFVHTEEVAGSNPVSPTL